MASSLLDVCRFTSVAGGTTDWAYSSAVTGYQSPAAAGVVNGATYSYRAESADLSQWEVGTGAYNTGTNTLSRSTVLFNSSGTTTKISFSAAPQVAIVALAEDLVRGQQGHIPGETGTGSAASGEIGEFISSTVATGTLTSNVATNITSISVPAGDWDVTAGYSAAGASNPSVTDIWVSINTVTATGVNTAGQSFRVRGMTLSDPVAAGSLGPLRVSQSGSTTYYLNTTCVYSGGTFAVTGILRARRVR